MNYHQTNCRTMGMNILVVDDSEIMRKVIERTFNICGYDSTSIFQASNGKEGLKIIEKHGVDLLLVDINMPIMNGAQMLEEIRQNKIAEDLAVVIVSAESNQERIDELSRFGAKFIHKPFTPEKLMAELDQLI